MTNLALIALVMAFVGIICFIMIDHIRTLRFKRLLVHELVHSVSGYKLPNVIQRKKWFQFFALTIYCSAMLIIIILLGVFQATNNELIKITLSIYTTYKVVIISIVSFTCFFFSAGFLATIGQLWFYTNKTNRKRLFFAFLVNSLFFIIFSLIPLFIIYSLFNIHFSIFAAIYVFCFYIAIYTLLLMKFNLINRSVQIDEEFVVSDSTLITRLDDDRKGGFPETVFLTSCQKKRLISAGLLLPLIYLKILFIRKENISNAEGYKDTFLFYLGSYLKLIKKHNYKKLLYDSQRLPNTRGNISGRTRNAVARAYCCIGKNDIAEKILIVEINALNEAMEEKRKKTKKSIAFKKWGYVTLSLAYVQTTNGNNREALKKLLEVVEAFPKCSFARASYLNVLCKHTSQIEYTQSELDNIKENRDILVNSIVKHNLNFPSIVYAIAISGLFLSKNDNDIINNLLLLEYNNYSYDHIESKCYLAYYFAIASPWLDSAQVLFEEIATAERANRKQILSAMEELDIFGELKKGVRSKLTPFDNLHLLIHANKIIGLNKVKNYDSFYNLLRNSIASNYEFSFLKNNKITIPIPFPGNSYLLNRLIKQTN